MNIKLESIISIEYILNKHLNNLYNINYQVKNLKDNKTLLINNIKQNVLYNFSLFKNNEYIFTINILENPSLIYYEFNPDYIFKLNLQRIKFTILENRKTIENSFLFNDLKLIHTELIKIISFFNDYFKLKLKYFLKIENLMFSDFYFLNFLSSIDNNVKNITEHHLILKNYDFDSDDFFKNQEDNFNELFSYLIKDFNCYSIKIDNKAVNLINLKNKENELNERFLDFLFHYYKEPNNIISYRDFIPINNFHKETSIDIYSLIENENKILKEETYLENKDYFYNDLIDILDIINHKKDKIKLYNNIIENDYIFHSIKEVYLEELNSSIKSNSINIRFISNTKLELYINKTNSVLYIIDIKEKTIKSTVNYHILYENKDIENSSAFYNHMKRELMIAKKFFEDLNFKEVFDKKISLKYKFFLLKRNKIIIIKTMN